jgi:periplasmic protein TonB
VSTAQPVFSLDISSHGYRDRSVKWAFALSVLVHAAAIALLPGLRLQLPQEPAPLVVELMALPQPENIAPGANVPPQPEHPAKRVVPSQKERTVLPPAPPLTRIEPTPTAPAEPQREITPELAPPPARELPPEPPPPAVIARPEPQIEREPAPRVEPQVTAKAEAPAPLVRQSAAALDTGALKAYGETLARALDKRKNYPRLARMRSWQGTTQLRLRIGPDGKLQDVSVGRSSGFELLDAAAIRMVHESVPLPDVPDVLRGREWTLTVPVVFKLEAS